MVKLPGQCQVKILTFESDIDTVFSQAFGIYKIGAKSTVQVEAATGRGVKIGIVFRCRDPHIYKGYNSFDQQIWRVKHSSTLIIKKLSPLDGPSIDPGTEGARLVGLYKYYTGGQNSKNIKFTLTMIEKSYKNKMKKKGKIEQKVSPSDGALVRTNGCAGSSSTNDSAQKTSTPRGSMTLLTTKSQPVTNKEETDASDIEVLKADKLFF